MKGVALEAPALEADRGASLEADLEIRFGDFVAENAERARRLAWRLVGGDEAAAEDIAQEAFVLVHEEGFTTREAARMLDRSQGTIKTHLHRALQALRRDLGDLRESTGERTK